MALRLNRIIDQAYSLYMPQVRFEIEMLSYLLLQRGIISTLEIGTKFGGSAYVWCRIMESMRDDKWFKYTSIDLVDGQFGGIDQRTTEYRNTWFNMTFSPDPNEIKKCIFISGDSHIIPVSEVKNSPQYYDFLFIDGDHSYEGVKADFEKYLPVVSSKGIIAFHDIVDSPKHRERGVYVAQFWDEIKYDDRFHSVELIGDRLNQDWAGIGVLMLKD